jgi:hypothetical protein
MKCSSPSIGQHLLSQLGGPRCGHFNVIQILRIRIAGAGGMLNQTDVTEDYGQQVIEIVSNPAGKYTQAFHLLGINHFLFQFSPIFLQLQSSRDIVPNGMNGRSAFVMTPPADNFQWNEIAGCSSHLHFTETAFRRVQ